MATLGRLLIDIAANTSQLKTDLDGARKDLGTFKGNVEGMMGSVGNLVKSGLGLLGIGLSFGAIAMQVKGAVTEFSNAERQSLRLDAVLKATGNTAGVSADKLKEMAHSLARNSLFDNKTILSAISQLLTFENISGKVLTSAIRLSVDLADLWDGDVSSAALALGKALQNPADAAAVLKRGHVLLTEEQKKTIEQMLRLNDVAGAQGTLIDILTGKVGGLAGQEASGLAGAFHRLMLNINEARKSLVGFFFATDQGLSDDATREMRLRSRAGIKQLPLGLPEIQSFGSGENISKDVSGLTALVGIDPKRVTGTEIAKLRELAGILPAAAREAAKAYHEGKGPLETWVRLLRELKGVQEALAKLAKPVFNNVGGLRDLSRMGATAEEQAALGVAIANSRLSSAMTGVGGERGLSPFGEEKQKRAAELWKQTWINAIEGTQEAFVAFFDSLGREGFKLVDLFKGIANAIKNALAQAASAAIVNSIFGKIIGSGPGGANSVGNVTQGGFSGSATVVNQNISLNVSAIDQVGVAQLLRAHAGTIAGVVAEAASSAPQFARHIVQQGSR